MDDFRLTSCGRALSLAEAKAIDREHLWHPYASIGTPPPTAFAVADEGTRIHLADGSTLIDAISSWWCAALGHRPPAVVEALRRQSEKMCHVMFAGFCHEPAIRLADLLLHLLPPPLEKIFLADSGSIAVECAVKMAVQYQYARSKGRKTRLVALRGAYHGDTAGAMALSDPDGMHILFRDVMPHHFFADQPKTPFDGTWKEEDFSPMEAILTEKEEEIAAVIVEPVFQGGNAMWLYHPEYLRHLRKACDRHDILLIFDEIATGLGRTGRLFAFEHAGILPDILCLGKILTGGCITLAATIASREVAEVISSRGSGAFMHGPTYMGNPLACAAAVAALETLQGLDWQERTARLEAGFRKGLAELAAHPNVIGWRALGAIGVLEVRSMPSSAQVSTAARETGVWLRPFGNWIYAMPPFLTTPDEQRQILQAMGHLAELGWERRDAPPPPSSDPILDIHE